MSKTITLTIVLVLSLTACAMIGSLALTNDTNASDVVSSDFCLTADCDAAQTTYDTSASYKVPFSVYNGDGSVNLYNTTYKASFSVYNGAGEVELYNATYTVPSGMFGQSGSYSFPMDCDAGTAACTLGCALL